MADVVLVAAVAAALIAGFVLGVFAGREERDELRQDLEARDTVLRFVFEVNEDLARRTHPSTATPADLEQARFN